ncbi:tyrosine-type recombinase/integrase [Paraburkholderia sp. RL17-337-BIB-A]|uniref:tyrosine-type recombinase/integrase n=1 Tax=Paraburkholderia sp. RL17-337-BIB-A TaxID=3031636 RepID=UPI0038BB24E4
MDAPASRDAGHDSQYLSADDCLRHSCALSILESTGDIRKVALWLGHASTQTTDQYLRVDTTTLLETMNSTVPPTLRKGHFRAPDQLIELLRTE